MFFFKYLIKPKKKKRSIILRQRGEHYDLSQIYSQVNEQYFNGEMDLPITWFGNKFSTPKTRVILGSYNHRTKLIKIHRLLDQAHVPHHFVSFIVYHEMLHHIVRPIRQRNRRKIHHAEFVLREKQFEHYHLAKEFDKELKKRLFTPERRPADG